MPDELPDKQPDSAASEAPTLVLPRETPAARPGSWGRWHFPEPEELERQMPGYEVQRRIGHGGMGAVYLGRQLSLARKVAIKVLPPELSGQAEFAARFQREARAMANLDHPNIVKVLEFGKTVAGLLYFTMEYVEGGDLQSRLKENGPLECRAAAELMHGVCAALECAHAAGIVHRDVKPANILLTPAGRPRVADFGLARDAGSPADMGMTLPGVVMGTPDYMAPEQRAGAPADARTDVYAAGVVLYQTLTATLPSGAWDPPSAVCRQRGAAGDVRLDAIVSRALQREPADRYTDAGAMRQALEALLPSHSATEQAGPRRAGWPALVLTALLLAGAAWLLWQTHLWRSIAVHVRALVINATAPVAEEDTQSIVLVDINRLKPRTQPGGPGEVNATPRDKLLALVEAIAAARPRAIGLDIDFSPHEDAPDKPYTPADPGFFRALLRLSADTGIPVFAGVWRQDWTSRAGWLGGAEFAPLAAGLGIAREEEDPVERLPMELKAHADGAALPSLSAALAQAGGSSPPVCQAPPWLMSRLAAPIDTGDSTVTEYAVNFASLDALLEQRVGGSDPAEIPGVRDRLRGKLVLLSDADLSQRADPFSVPTRRNEPVPGGYIHACGIATLLSGPPAILTTTGRLLAGALFAGLLCGGFLLVERRVARRAGRINAPFARRAGRLLFASVVLLLTWAVLRWHRIAWPDGIYLCAALLVWRPLALRVNAAGTSLWTAWRGKLYAPAGE